MAVWDCAKSRERIMHRLCNNRSRITIVKVLHLTNTRPVIMERKTEQKSRAGFPIPDTDRYPEFLSSFAITVLY